MRKMRNVFALTVCALVLGCVFSTQTISAANFIVNTTTDLPDADTTDQICADANNQCSLRAAIGQISVLAEPVNTIQFAAALLDQTVQLDSGLPPLDRNTTISGLGVARLSINGNGAANALTIANGNPPPFAPTSVVVGNLTITNAATAIRNNAATLIVSNARLTGNTGGANGGGVFNNGGATDILFSTLDNNSVGASGGAVFNTGGTVRIANSTISNNFGGGFGGGVMNADGILSQAGATLTSRTELTNVTISNNTAITSGGGVFNQNNLTIGNTIAVRNTIIADNQTNSNDDAGGAFISGGDNLVENPGTSTGFAAANNDILNQPPNLDNLGNNGGQTPTRRLLAGSAAINQGNNCVTDTTCPIFNPPVALTNDQRNVGFRRQVGAMVDIGAYEFGVTTAAFARVGGRVTTPRGKSIARARVSIVAQNGDIKTAFTNAFGYYNFNQIAAGETYLLSVSHKSYEFAEQVVSILSDNHALNFVSER